MEKQITYKEFIQNIIDTRGQWNIPDGECWEGHHILPVCLGGKGRRRSRNNNIIWLYPDEHYIAHKLLALENPNNKDLLLAWNVMSHDKFGNLISADEYKVLREALSDISKGENNPMYGKHHTEDSLKKISDAISGEKHWNYGNTGSKCVWWGKHHSLETKLKMSNSAKGKPKSEEAKQHMRENNVLNRPVICIETGEVFFNSNEAGRRIGILGSNINRCCKGTRKTAGGFHWRFVD